MAGRQRGAPPPPPPPPPPHQMIEDHRLLRRGPPPSSSLLEERLAINHHEIQLLLSDNRQLTASHVALKQDLSLAEAELEKLAVTGRSIIEERELKVKELYEKSLKLECEVRVSGVQALKMELDEVREDIKKLSESKIELTAQLKAIDGELSRVKVDAVDVPAIRADVDNMRKELQKGRAAIEFEKKTRAENLKQSRAMERNMVSVQREMDRLIVELANAEKRARATAAAAAAAADPSPGYMGSYGSSNSAFGGPYPHYPMRQAQTVADSASPSPYVPHVPVSSNGPTKMQ